MWRPRSRATPLKPSQRHRRARFRLIEALAAHVAVPVIGEGRFNTPADVRRGFEAGAHAIVVGTMITNPREITRRFVAEGVPA